MDEDLILKRYLSDDDRYADLINGFGFSGEQIVSAADLTELDSQSRYYISTEEQGQSRRRGKYRDLVRKTAFGVNFAVIGVENQKEVHYLMPVRSMGYDSREYERQAAIKSKEVRKRGILTSAEFLSGFTKEDRLHPCITIVLFFGEEWDGSLDLHGILDFSGIPEKLKKLINNYRVNLLEVRRFENTDVFHTDLKQVFDFIRFSKDKKKLKELIEKDSSYAKLDEAAYDVAVAFTKAKALFEIKEKYRIGDGVNMCQALSELLQDERIAGMETGRLEGKIEGKIESVYRLVENKIMELEAALELIGVTKKEYYNSQIVARKESRE